MYKKNHKNTHKQKKSELAFEPLTQLLVFLGFLDFLTWKDPQAI